MEDLYQPTTGMDIHSCRGEETAGFGLEIRIENMFSLTVVNIGRSGW